MARMPLHLELIYLSMKKHFATEAQGEKSLLESSSVRREVGFVMRTPRHIYRNGTNMGSLYKYYNSIYTACNHYDVLKNIFV